MGFFLLLCIFLVLFIMIFFLFAFMPIGLIVKALTSGLNINPTELIGMRLKRINQSQMVDTLIKLKKNNLSVSKQELENNYIEGVNIDKVSRALIDSSVKNIPVGFSQIATLEMMGEDSFRLIDMNTQGTSLETPVITGTTKDRTPVKAKVQLEVRVNMNNYLFLPGVGTVIARACTSVISFIGSKENPGEVADNTNLINQAILEKQITCGTSCELISVNTVLL